jgi:hypothetical protein
MHAYILASTCLWGRQRTTASTHEWCVQDSCLCMQQVVCFIHKSPLLLLEWDKQTTTWNQTTVNTPLTNRHNCNHGDQQATTGLQVTYKAPRAWHTTNWAQTLLKPRLDSGLQATGKLTLLGAVEKPPQGGHVALNSQHRLSHALQSCIASTWTTGSRRSASKPSFWHRKVRHYS